MDSALPRMRNSAPAPAPATSPLRVEPSRALPERRRRSSTRIRAIATEAAFAAPHRDDPARRLLNMLLALLGIAVALPVMVIVAAMVKLTSRGPVLYTQTRVGVDRRRNLINADNHRRDSDIGGRPFTIYKFRTMHVNAEQHGAVWATQNDPRVTSVGRVLRQYRLDELPQLFNVLRGDMNIVGPRPERPTIVAELRENISEYPLRHRARPGITGLAQISQQYDASVDDVRNKVKYDLEYIRRQGLIEDIKIMLKTIPVVLFRKGGW
jgi:lipopolysaccharide/colanic/teichoic acid biosynthesis glycosyltransferase